MRTLVALPSAQPGGLGAALSAHFGHCDLYTLVSLEEGRIKEVKTIPNVPHQQGGCLAPVQYLSRQGVEILISGGMGMRPLAGFNQMGIEVYYSGGGGTVGEAVTALVEGRLPLYGEEHTCGGGGGQRARNAW
jgi:predicted Fe-Mo cluster-binding NifX family protein